MRTRVLALIALATLGAGSGCAANPFGEQTEPALERFGVRVTSGLGAADAYLDSVDVEPDSTVQFEALVADGRVLTVTMPRRPAEQIVASATVDGSDEVVASTTLRSRSGKLISVADPSSFDPGYVGIEAGTDPDNLVLRVATPRLTGTGQGQVPFTFKAEVVDGAQAG